METLLAPNVTDIPYNTSELVKSALYYCHASPDVFRLIFHALTLITPSAFSNNGPLNGISCVFEPLQNSWIRVKWRL